MDKKNYIPEGMTEEEVVSIIYRVCRAVAPKFKFGYHSSDDLIAHGVMLSIKFLSEGKFKPRGDKPLAKQLTNFLYVWVNNRLINYRRDNSNRSGCMDREPDKSKYNLMHCLLVHSQDLTHSDIFAVDTDIPSTVHRRDVIERVLAGLTANQKEIYYKMINEEFVSESDQAKLFKKIQNILGEGFEL